MGRVILLEKLSAAGTTGAEEDYTLEDHWKSGLAVVVQPPLGLPSLVTYDELEHEKILDPKKSDDQPKQFHLPSLCKQYEKILVRGSTRKRRANMKRYSL